MLSASSGPAFGILYTLWFIVGSYIYVSLIRQINARRASSAGAIAAAESTSTVPTARTFGLPEAILAAVLIVLLLLSSVASFSHSTVELSSRGLVSSLFVTIGVVIFIAVFLALRGLSLETLGGLSVLRPARAITTGAILLFFAYPIISVSDLVVQQFLRGSSSKQSIVEMFNSSQTINERVIIIVFAVALAPMAEEFLFRFFIFGVLKRYFGLLFGLVANALLFAAVHGHLPSLAALFVLGACFTIAYEWSGSILVSMTMHSLFNAVTLVVLAFPDTFQQ
jgi:uncharacterized protein